MATPEGTLYASNPPVIKNTIPCDCCELCRYAWCGGSTIPDTLTALVDVASSWAVTIPPFYGTGCFPINIPHSYTPGALLSNVAGVSVTLTRVNSTTDCCYYTGSTTTSAFSCRYGCSESYLYYGCTENTGIVEFRVIVTAALCDKVTTNGRYQNYSPRYVIVSVIPLALRDAYGSLVICPSPTDLRIEGVNTPSAGCGLFSPGVNLDINCSGGNITATQDCTVDHSGDGISTGLTTTTVTITN